MQRDEWAAMLLRTLTWSGLSRTSLSTGTDVEPEVQRIGRSILSEGVALGRSGHREHCTAMLR